MLSDFSKNRRTTQGSVATEGHFNRPLSDLSINLDQLNSDVSTELDAKSDSGHTHDDRYYTQSESDTSYAPSDHTHEASDVDVGTFANARIAETNVTQHESALSLSGSQVTSGFLPDSVVSQNVARYEDSSASFEGQIGSKRTDVGTGGSHHTFDLDEGNAQKVQLTSDTTLHFANADPGHAYVVEVQQTGSGSALSVFWDPGVVPSTETLPQMPSANSETLVASVYAQSTTTFMAGEFGTGALEG